MIQSDMPDDRPTVIVVGNEKGGSGKSTLAIHIASSLLKLGVPVTSIDLDARQGSLTRFWDLRRRYAERNGLALSLPDHFPLLASGDDRKDEKALSRLLSEQRSGYIVIDTPGADTGLSRVAHRAANTLVTPINDSYLDVDVLAQIDPVERVASAPSTYTRMVWEQNNLRAGQGIGPIDWVVIRNRISHANAHNHRDIGELLVLLAKRIGFRVIDGFSERVVFRELFPQGLTLLDLPGLPGFSMRSGPSEQSARREIMRVLEAVRIVGERAAA